MLVLSAEDTKRYYRMVVVAGVLSFLWFVHFVFRSFDLELKYDLHDEVLFESAQLLPILAAINFNRAPGCHLRTIGLTLVTPFALFAVFNLLVLELFGRPTSTLIQYWNDPKAQADYRRWIVEDEVVIDSVTVALVDHRAMVLRADNIEATQDCGLFFKKRLFDIRIQYNRYLEFERLKDGQVKPRHTERNDGQEPHQSGHPKNHRRPRISV